MEPARQPEIEAQPLHRIARVPIRVTNRGVRWALALTLAVDLALTASYLASTLPEVRQLTASARLASLDFVVVANIPWSWGVLKLYAIAATCALMAFSYSGGQRPDAFWRVGAIIGFILALAESARLHEIWAASVAPALFGSEGDGSHYSLISRGLLLAVFYIAALSLFPARSRAAFVCFILSIVAIALSQFGPPMILVSDWTAPFSFSTIIVAWSGALQLLSSTLILGGLWFGMRDIQAVSVRYVYRG